MGEKGNKKPGKLNSDSSKSCVFLIAYLAAYAYTIGSEMPLIFW